MFKRLLAACAVLALAAMMFGCGGSGKTQGSSSSSSTSSASQPAAQAQPQPKNLILSDWNYVIDNDTVHYMVEITNPNHDFSAESAHITVVGRTPDGAIAFKDDWTVGGIMPATTTYWGTFAGVDQASPDDTIEITLSVDDDDWVSDKRVVPADQYTFSNVTASPGTYGGMQVTGEITMSQGAIGLSYHKPETPMVVCVFKDDAGNIIGGFDGFVHEDLEPGVPTVFDIDSYVDFPEHATLEMYANPWP